MDDSALRDKIELRELLARLCRGVDRADEELVASCYTADSVDRHGTFEGTGREFARYICHESPVSGDARFLHHSLGQSLFDVEGDRATGETYFNFHMVTEPDALYQGIGRYVDVFARVDGKWLIAERTVVTEWTGRHQVRTLGPGPADHTGARDRSDPVYSVAGDPAARAD